MKVKNLKDIDFDKVIDCFFTAFKNYFVELPTDKEFFRKRWEMAKVDFNLSYGMFEDDKLVGFIIHAIDKRNGELIAFNTGTGVIPEYRGQKIVKSIYQYALNDLKKNGITKCTLEVIKQNEIAINSYKSTGFEIVKSYKCFNGKIKINGNVPYELKALNKEEVKWGDLPNQNYYSWDNQKETVVKGCYEYYQVLHNNNPESFFIINSENGYIPQFDTLIQTNESWERLFSGIQSISETIKINNVDEALVSKINYLNKIGLKNTVDQFEMELLI